MEVTHNENMDTHAVIGGAKVRAFGISDNAEFITMLSEGLYSDKMMAVIREVLCNAHDAHVANKCLDIPIKISLKDGKLTITDFGKGIHDQAINAIYCVYGNSTKTHNGEENGGFGLGSKAPFAYTNHFTVVSKHAGTKTIYAVSRGSSETQGKPDMREMVAVPTTETGLEVSLPLKTAADADTFENLIRNVTYFGEMNVELNGEKLPTLPFSQLTEKYMVVNKDDQKFMRQRGFSSKIFLRYGTVIYPIEPHDEYIDDYNYLGSLVESGRRIVIVQAQPNTIAVTPSRESLSMTKRTLATITGLLKDVSSTLKDKALPAYKELLEQYMASYKASGLHYLRANMFEYSFNSHTSHIKDFLNQPLTSSHDVAKMMMVTNSAHTKSTSVFFVDANVRFSLFLAMLSKHDPDKAPYYRVIKKAINPESVRYYKDEIRLVWNKFTIGNLSNILGKENLPYLRVRSKVYRHETPKVTSVKDAKESWFGDYLFDSDRITIAHNIKDLNETAEEEANYDNSFALLIPRKKGLREALIDKLEKAGYEVINGCFDPVKKQIDPNAMKKPKGYVRLTSVTNSATGSYMEGHMSSHNVERIERPLNILVERTLDYKRVVMDFETFDMRAFSLLVPNAVVVSNINTYHALIKKGGFSAKDSLCSKVEEIFLTDPDFLRIIYDKSKSRTGVMASLHRFIKYDPKIAAMFEGKSVQNPKVLAAVRAYEYFENRYNIGEKPRKLVGKVQEALRTYKDNDPLNEQLTSNVLLAALDLNAILHSVSTNAPHASKQMSLLHLALG